VRLARAYAIPNLHPDYACMKAPGVITLVVLPYLPLGRPLPCPGLLQAVRAYLSSRRVLGTRIVVVGPRYVTVSVRARLQASNGVALEDVQRRATEALNTFLHPLAGGPDGTGWPFGRDVYRSEILQVLDETPGVDHVLSLELVGEDGVEQCGNFCLGPLGLIDAGEHRIEVV
jgi:predicted phage baseplate assembly protein